MIHTAALFLTLQFMQATVSGTVRDATTGEPLVGATVVFTDLDRAVGTDPRGRYAMREVPAGPQHLSVRLIGYAQLTLHALVPRAGRLEIDVALQPLPARLALVEVRPTVIIRGVEAGDTIPYPDRGMSVAAVRNHPLLAEPDVLQALGGGEVVFQPETPSGMHIRGGGSDQTAYLLDGLPIFSPYHAGGTFSAWNPDALAGVEVDASLPPPEYPDALSGAVVAITKDPAARTMARGGVSTTQARVTVDGPIDGGTAGYVVSARAALPDIVAPPDEGSYIGGAASDALAKLTSGLLGGRMSVLGYLSRNSLDAASVANVPDGPDNAQERNIFEWQSATIGAAWQRQGAMFSLRLRGWSAHGSADSRWAATMGPVSLATRRRDLGIALSLRHQGPAMASLAGIRLETSHTTYHVEQPEMPATLADLDGRTPVAAGFVQHSRPIGPRARLDVAGSLTAAAGGLHFGPRVELRWHPTARITVTSSYARLHQFAQSLRNPESVVGTIFPADLYVGAAVSSVPVARSDQGIIAVDYDPMPGFRLGAQAYARALDGLVFVAPRTGEPFAAGQFLTGSGRAHGIAVDAAVTGARLGVVASYGWQHVRHAYADSSYAPGYSAAHVIDAGGIVFPSVTWSVRLGATAVAGRRTTPLAGELEWEACNLLDRGCEFGGSPRYTGPVSRRTLPAYLRIDLGVRKHWHFTAFGRDAEVAAFASLTNLFDRRNVLTYSTDPASGQLIEVSMRPRAPLVVGLDWRY